MDTSGWESAKELFYEALERTGEARDALLGGVDPDVRREVEALLQAHERAQARAEASEPKPDGPGATIGRYKLLQEIGEGGFGVVFLAEQQEPVHRRVALKIIKVGMDTKQVIARFEAERQALAILDHPNIAKVLDAGTTETGRPYFVMELVKGIPVTEYCDQASLDTRERLGLFADVCRAVQHAHHKGIIHRDLKPGNVLVTLHDGKPVPKVIDFGIAKATDRHLTEKTLFTEFRQIIGTPEYMAPEQAALSGLDVDTRADVYSLGVLLYELLTGAKPFEMKTLMEQGWNEILRVIREVDPPRPSTKLSTMGDEAASIAKSRQTEPRLLGRLVKGDLDWIVMKALEKDRTRRYETAEALARDLERYLEDRPVEATPPSAAYRFRKYVRRNKAAVVGVAAVFAALLAGFVFTTLGFVEARRQRATAVAERDDANRARAAETAARGAAEEAAADAARERDEKEAARVELADALETSEGTRLLAQSQAVLRKDPELALLLAIEGAERVPGWQANRALLAAIERAHCRIVVCDVAAKTWFAEFAPDGRRVATSHEDGNIRVWDLETGALLKTLPSPGGPLGRFVWVPDRNVIAAVSFGGGAAVWDGATYERRCAIPPDGNGVRAHGMGGATFSRDGTRAVYGRWGVGARLYDLAAGVVLDTLPYREGEWLSLAPDGDSLLVVRADARDPQRRCVVLRDLETGGERTLCTSPYPNTPAWFSPDGAHVLVSAGEDGARLYETRTGEVAFTLPSGDDPDRRPVGRAGFSADGGRIFTSDGRQTWIWDARDGHRIATLRDTPVISSVDLGGSGRRLFALERRDGFALRVYCASTGAVLHDAPLEPPAARMSVSPDGRRVALMGYDGGLRILHLAQDRSLLAGEGGCRWIPLGPEGRYFVSSSLQQRPSRIWDVDALRPLRHLDDHRVGRPPLEGTFHSAMAVGASPDGRRIVTGGPFGEACLWDAATGRQLRAWDAHRGPIWSAVFSPDGTRVLTAAQDETARVWDVETGACLSVLGEERPFGAEGLRVIQIHGRWAAYDTKGERILARLAQEDGAQVWDAKSGTRLFGCESGEGIVIGAQFTVGDRAIVVTTRSPAGWRTTIHDPQTGRRLHDFTGLSASGASAVRSSSLDGRYLLVSRPGIGIAVHAIDSGRSVRTLPLDSDTLLVPYFSPDDRFVAAQSLGGMRLVAWSFATGGRILDVPEKGSIAGYVPFTADSEHLLVRTEAGVRAIPLDPLPTARALAARALTPAERELYAVAPTARLETPLEGVRLRAEAAPWDDEDSVVAALRRLVSPLLPDAGAADEAERLLRLEVRAVGLPEVALVRVLDVLADRARADLAWERAEALYRACHERALARWGRHHTTTEVAARRLADACIRTGHAVEAESLVRGLLEAWRVDGREFRLFLPLTALGESLLAQGRAEEAEPVLREAIEAAFGAYGQEEKYGQTARGLLGAALAAQGRREEAKDLLTEAAEAMDGLTRGQAHVRTEALARVVAFYEEGGEAEEAAAWRAKATPEERAKLGWTVTVGEEGSE